LHENRSKSTLSLDPSQIEANRARFAPEYELLGRLGMKTGLPPESS